MHNSPRFSCAPTNTLLNADCAAPGLQDMRLRFAAWVHTGFIILTECGPWQISFYHSSSGNHHARISLSFRTCLFRAWSSFAVETLCKRLSSAAKEMEPVRFCLRSCHFGSLVEADILGDRLRCSGCEFIARWL